MTTPDIDRPDPLDGPRSEPTPVTEIRIADAAARAARATAGVAHLQPGVWGLVHQIGSDVWARVTGRPHPDTAGVEVLVDGDTIAIEVSLVCDGRRPVTVVTGDVQRTVDRAVRAGCSLMPTRIAVHVVDIVPPR